MADLRLLPSGQDLVVQARDAYGAHVVSISGEADLQTEHQLSGALRDAVPQPGTALILDLTALTFCSAYAMNVLIDIVGSSVHQGVKVAVVGLPPVTARVWLLTDVPIPIQYASVDLAIAAIHSATARSADHLDAEAGTTRLLAEVDGLRRALATRAIIEQAKGMLMERLTCTSDEAFNLIVLQSQRSTRRMHDVAADYLGSGPNDPVIRGLPHLARLSDGAADPEATDPEPAA